MYIIRITFKPGNKYRYKYLGFNPKCYGLPHLYTNKDSAQKFTNKELAQFVSDSFWERFWLKGVYELRQILEA